MVKKSERLNGGIRAIYWAMIILLCPLSWIIALTFAAGIHGLGHSVALRCCGKRIKKFEIGIDGARLETADLSTGQELFCTLAGPLAGFLPILAMEWIPRIAFCALMQSLFNLLPIYPLDGGRIVRCMARLLKIPQVFCTALEYIILCALVLLAIYGTLGLHLGFAPMAAMGILLLRTITRKRPCKQVAHWI